MEKTHELVILIKKYKNKLMARSPQHPLTPAEKKLWEEFTRNISPSLGKRKSAVSLPVTSSLPPKALKESLSIKLPRPQKPPSKSDDILPPDRRTLMRLKKGLIPLEDRLDLHGLTQDKAFKALARFIQKSVSENLRCVLVITGKGERTGGVLRHIVPLWLGQAHLRPFILALAPAHIQHGGNGALYVLLRRQQRVKI